MRQKHGLLILLLGDRSGVSAPLADSLRLDEHRVEIVADATTFCKVVRGAMPDVVFLDTGLLGLDAKSLIREIQEASQWRRPLLIALAAEGTKDDEATYVKAGVDLYLAKPPEHDEVRSLLRRFQGIVQDLDAFDPVI